MNISIYLINTSCNRKKEEACKVIYAKYYKHSNESGIHNKLCMPEYKFNVFQYLGYITLEEACKEPCKEQVSCWFVKNNPLLERDKNFFRITNFERKILEKKNRAAHIKNNTGMIS